MNHEQRPSTLLKEIALATEQAIERSSDNKDMQHTWTGIAFSLCGQHMVAPLGEVVEIIKVPPYTFIPRVKKWVLGLANVRGRLLPIVDLELYFGSRLAGNRSRHRVLIIEISGFYVGLVVSHVFGLKHFANDAFEEGFDSSEELFARCIDAQGIENGNSWLRFSPTKLLRDENFIDASLKNSGGSNSVSETAA